MCGARPKESDKSVPPLSNCLRAKFANNVQNNYQTNEDERAGENGGGANLEARRVLLVEAENALACAVLAAPPGNAAVALLRGGEGRVR